MKAEKRLKIQRVTETSDFDGRVRVIGYQVIDPVRYVAVSGIYVRRVAALDELKRQQAL